MSDSSKAIVVLVHGLWCNRWIMFPLSRRLRRVGFETKVFEYASVRKNCQQNAEALYVFLQQLSAYDQVHIVAHSLGGLVVMQMFQNRRITGNGAVVLLGTPLQGSYLARRLMRVPFGKRLLGKSIDHGLLDRAAPWEASRPLGTIAGTVRFGLGLLLGGGLRAGDGVVALDETSCKGATDATAVPASHTGLLFSQQVAACIKQFILNKKFS